MNKKTYTGSKIQNHFTAYLIQFVRGKRHDYLEKKIQMADAEELLEDIGQMEARIVIEELMENQTREQLLLQEAQGAAHQKRGQQGRAGGSPIAGADALCPDGYAAGKRRGRTVEYLQLRPAGVSAQLQRFPAPLSRWNGRGGSAPAHQPVPHAPPEEGSADGAAGQDRIRVHGADEPGTGEGIRGDDDAAASARGLHRQGKGLRAWAHGGACGDYPAARNLLSSVAGFGRCFNEM